MWGGGSLDVFADAPWVRLNCFNGYKVVFGY